MKGQIKTTTVMGRTFKVWSDFIARATFAESEDGEVKAIKRNGYISNDLTIRKEIARVYGFESFRK